MNHCLLEVEVTESPKIRYTQENQTPIAEMLVKFDALRDGDPPGELKVIGWGNLAQDLQNRVQVGHRLMLEGRMRMTTHERQDGTKEKKAEFTLSRIHPIAEPTQSQKHSVNTPPDESSKSQQNKSNEEIATWNAAPLVPDNDEIPF